MQPKKYALFQPDPTRQRGSDGLIERLASRGAATDGRALVIDLEGALLKSDLLHEAMAAGGAGSLVRLWRALLGGASAIERELEAACIDHARLPYDSDILNLALVARAQGRKIYLAIARFQAHAEAIAAHFGFDGVIALADLPAGGGEVAIEGPGRAIGPFDYVGGRRGRDDDPQLMTGMPSAGRGDVGLRAWLQALRVHQYAKNTLVFIPAFTSHQMNWSALGEALLAFVAFSACASGAYLLNDLLDLAADRSHPNKRHRPIAAGEIPIAAALAAIPALWVIAAASAACLSGAFLAIVGLYLAATVAYSLVLKRMMLVDILALAGLYTIRIVGGAVAIGVHLSEWLLMFSLFVFTSLALIKRYGELVLRQSAGLPDPPNRDYRLADQLMIAAMAASSGMSAVIVFSLYAASPVVGQMYSRPWMLWLLNPLLLYWIGRALMMAHRQAMSDDPIIYAFKDGASRATVAAMVGVVLLAI